MVHNGPQDHYDDPHAIAVDAMGNIYITSESFFEGKSLSLNWLTIAYAPDGTFLWEKLFHGSHPYGDARPHDIAVDHLGNIIVVGSSRGPGTLRDFGVVKYAPDGEELWSLELTSPGLALDSASAVVIDDQNNIYAAGRIRAGAYPNIYIIKISPDGAGIWDDSYNSPEVGKSTDYAYNLALGPGSVQVVGVSSDPAEPIVGTVLRLNKYDADTGALLWSKSNHALDEGQSIVVDAQGITYVYGDVNVSQEGLAAYDSDGNELWTNLILSAGARNSKKCIAPRPEGGVNMIVTIELPETARDIVLHRYAPDGTLVCETPIDFDYVRQMRSQEVVIAAIAGVGVARD